MRQMTIPLLITLAGCFSMPKRKAVFVESEYAPYSGNGAASIAGQAFSMTRGGDVKYGAGKTVLLNPVTSYSSEWPYFDAGGYRDLQPSDPFAYRYCREAVADGQGNFTFEGLPAGDYYVACNITWQVSRSETTGGWVSARVRIADGETKTGVILR